MATATYTDVDAHYSRLAREAAQGHDEKSAKVALSFGYSKEELAAIPEGSNLGVSCGNPLALAGLKDGETVVDLGSGAGFDVFLASQKVGKTGMAIGVDMSKDMLARARLNATKTNATNVKFVESKITAIDLEPNTTDCVISNCVINLVPENDKHLVFKEVFRILKPGGRLAVSDILAKKPFPPDVAKSVGLYVGCISGASLVEQYEQYLADAGFEDVLIVDKKVDLNVYKETELFDQGEGNKAEEAEPETKENLVDEMRPACCGTANKVSAPKETSCCGTGEELSTLVKGTDFNVWVGSYNVYAVKPAAID